MIVCELLAPTATLPKPTMLGFAVNPGCTPVPVIAIVSGDPGALLVIVMVPMGLPAESGVNFAVIVELAPAAIVIGSVNPLTEYPVPDAVSAEIVRLRLPLLLNVIVCEPLLPTSTLPKATLVGLAERED